MLLQKYRYLIYVCVCIFLVALEFRFAAVANFPIDGPAFEKYAQETYEGKLLLVAFDSLLKKDFDEFSRMYLEPSRLQLSANEIDSYQKEAEKFIEEKKLKFLRFNRYSLNQVGEVRNSKISAWFTSVAQPDLYVKIEVIFSGSTEQIKVDKITWAEFPGKLSFSYPSSYLSFAKIAKLPFVTIFLIFVSALSLCVSGIAITTCLLTLNSNESKKIGRAHV